VFVTPLRGYQALDLIGLYDKDDIGRNNDNKSVFLFFFFLQINIHVLNVPENVALVRCSV